MTNEPHIHYADLEGIHTDVLIDLPYDELESYIRETRAMIDNNQLVLDRLRVARMEKIRRECASRAKAGET